VKAKFDVIQTESKLPKHDNRPSGQPQAMRAVRALGLKEINSPWSDPAMKHLP
jgi:hypothetical protein